jgi:nitrate reductase delta subunit
MHSIHKEQLNIVSYLLQYPEPQWLNELAAERDMLEACFAEPACSVIRRVIDYLIETPLLSSQEAYSATFDLQAATCLNLSYHRYGDAKERGEELARFAAAYQASGFEPALSELPDYLPMLLELAAHSPGGEGQDMLREYASSLALLSERLEAEKSPYAGLFQVLTALLQPETDQERGVCHG